MSNNKKTNSNFRDTSELENSSSFIFGFFINFFKPSAYLKSVFDINIEKLQKQGIKMIICDLDNTLVPYFTKFPTKTAIEFVERVKKSNMEFILISNNRKKRVTFFAQKLNVDKYISRAKKPLTRSLKKSIKKYGYSAQEVCVVGDLIVTDILAANILNAESILVQPLVDYNVGWNKIFNWLEHKIFKRLEKKNLIASFDHEKEEILSNKYEVL